MVPGMTTHDSLQSPLLPPARREQLAALQERLGVVFPDLETLDTALTHPSFLGEKAHAHRAESNQRLEFLGDSMLGLAVSEYLYHRYPELPEGELTKIKAAVVSETGLQRAARELNLGEEIRLGHGEEASGGRTRPSVLADAFEALVGAILVELGADAAREFVLRCLAAEIDRQGTAVGLQDHKSRLQELTQSRSQGTPDYAVVAEHGPDHRKTFEVEVRAGHRILGHGAGRSKKEAEQQAAKQAVEKLTADPHLLHKDRH